MSTRTLLAVLLIVLGVVAFGYQGFTYRTRSKAVDLGPVQVTAEHNHTVPLPPIVGAIALIGGIAILITGSGRRV